MPIIILWPEMIVQGRITSEIIGSSLLLLVRSANILYFVSKKHNYWCHKMYRNDEKSYWSSGWTKSRAIVRVIIKSTSKCYKIIQKYTARRLNERSSVVSYLLFPITKSWICFMIHYLIDLMLVAVSEIQYPKLVS